MAFLTRDVAYIFYPGLQYASIGDNNSSGAMINGCIYEQEENVKTNIALAKYSARNFVFQPPPPDHTCRKDPLCPHTTRDLLDEHSFAFPMREGMTDYEISDAICMSVPLSYSLNIQLTLYTRPGMTAMSSGAWAAKHVSLTVPLLVHAASWSTNPLHSWCIPLRQRTATKTA